MASIVANIKTWVTGNLLLLCAAEAWILANLFRFTFGNSEEWTFYLLPIVQIILLGVGFSTSNGFKKSNSFRFLITASVTLPFAISLFLRYLNFYSDPWEVVTLISVSNLAFCFGFFDQKNVFKTLLFSIVPVFMILSMESSFFVNTFGAFFGFTVVLWLALRHWSSLDKKSAVSCNKNRTRGLSFYSLLGTGFLVAGLLLSGFGGRIPGHLLAQISPFSGGDSWADRHARDGVGNGELLTAATDNPDTFGPVDSDIFLESKGATLFDVVSDQYGEPRKPNGNRAVALNQTVMQHNHQKLSSGNKTSGNSDFSLARNKPKSSLDQSKSDALFFVIGACPVHLPMKVYSKFEGNSWKANTIEDSVDQKSLNNLPRPKRDANRSDGRPWMSARTNQKSSTNQWYDFYEIQINELSTLQFPAPYRLHSFCIEKVDRDDFFRISPIQSPILRNGCSRIPKQTVLMTRSNPISIYQELRYPEKTQKQLVPNLRFLQDELEKFEDSGIIDDVISKWTEGNDSDWEKVQSITKGFRDNFQLDRQKEYDYHERHFVSKFLKEKSGPDFLFATATALFTRKCGIPSRVVQGFHVDPKNSDFQTGQTAVLNENLHFWTEVSLDGKTWIPVEPTPGYQPPNYSLTIVQRLTLMGLRTSRWIQTHPLISLILLSLIVTVIWNRFLFYDFIWTVHCRIKLLLNSPDSALSVAKLLEYRSQLAGKSRRKDKSLATFLRNNLSTISVQSDLERFCFLLNQSLYGPKPNPSNSSDHFLQIVSHYTYYTISKKSKKQPTKQQGK